MPLVRVYYPEGLSDKEGLQKVSTGIHQSLVDHFKIPEKDYFQLFLPYPPGQFLFDSFYLLEGKEKRTDSLVHVSITCGPGRSIDQKEKLYHAIAEAFSKQLQLSTADIFITLNETPAENWSFGQGIAQMVDRKAESGRE